MAVSLWTRWSGVRRRLEGAERLFLFLDFDGTLSPIVAHAAQARLPAPTRRVLEALVARPDVRVALVSGRRLSDLRRRVGARGLCYVGNHGLELQGGGVRRLHPAARRARPLIGKIARRLQKALQAISGAWVEDKGLTLSVHFREVRQEAQPRVRRLFQEAVRSERARGRLRVTPGKRVFEVRPRGPWNKGSVVRWLSARWRALPPGGGPGLQVYVGDDITDEDAFRVLREAGITVAVGRSTAGTHARYTVRDPRQVRRFLQRILEIRRGRKAQKGAERAAR